MTTTAHTRDGVIWWPSCPHHDVKSYMEFDGQRICLDCAAKAYEQGDKRGHTAWLLVSTHRRREG